MRKHKQLFTVLCACWHILTTLLCLIIVISDNKVESFNVEFRQPIVKKGERHTYFGYSVAQHIDDNRNPWLLVGAPLGNNLQPDTNRSGALFKCPMTFQPNDCKQVETDGRRPPNEDMYDDDLSYEEDTVLQPPGKDEIKNGQWLGVTVKSQNPSHGGKVIVCAHRYIKSPNLTSTHHGLGLCHLLNGSLHWEEALEPCEGKPVQNEHLEYAFCQAGTSLEFLKDGTALMGAPGPHTWRGTIFAKMTVGAFLTRDKNFYSSPLNDRPEPIDKYSYLGMSVTGGKFFDKHKITYVSGAPRANLTGQVYLVEKEYHSKSQEMTIRLILKGAQVASNYGYELLAADVNGDGYDDLFVSAPFFFNNTIGGAVYIYYNLRYCSNYTCEPDEILFGKQESRFGFALTSLGDINKDGFTDIAIGAPYETFEDYPNTSGAIYIYLGGRDNLERQQPQKIFIPNYSTIGYSLSGGVDMDGNHYPDLLTGAYNEDIVILFKTRAIVHIDIEVKDSDMKNIDVNKKGCRFDPTSSQSCFTLEVCIRTNGKQDNIRNIKSQITADLGKMKGQYIRVKFNQTSDSNIATTYFDMRGKRMCHNYTLYIKDGIRDILSPIEFSVKYELKNEPHTPILNQTSTKNFKATFLKDCGVNEVCESALEISAGLAAEYLVKDREPNLYTLDLGNIKELHVQVNVSNDGESAYEANLFIIHPNSLSYIAILNKELQGDIKCTYHNETWIACNLGNPFVKNRAVNLNLRFENRNNVKNDGFLDFKVFVNTTSNTITNETAASFKVEVKMTPNIKIDTYGTGSVVFGGIHKGESAITYYDEIGSRVKHSYQITNDGKWPIGNLEALIDWPIQIQSSMSIGKWLLYLETIPVVEWENTLTKCQIMPPHNESIVNELNYTSRPNQSENMAPENMQMMPLSSFTSIPTPFNVRNKRDIEEIQEMEEDITPARLMVGPGELIKNNHTFDCATGTAKCVKIKCALPTIESNSGATINILSRLWNATLIEDFSDKSAVGLISRIRIVSTSKAEVILKDNEAMAMTTAYSNITTLEKSIPWWIIIAASLGGILLFAVAVWILYCCGFFKRNQPPTQTAQTSQKSEIESLLSK